MEAMIAARCEIDLSPGTVTTPLMDLAGLMITKRFYQDAMSVART